jgi:hypothetical protein
MKVKQKVFYLALTTLLCLKCNFRDSVGPKSLNQINVLNETKKLNFSLDSSYKERFSDFTDKTYNVLTLHNEKDRIYVTIEIFDMAANSEMMNVSTFQENLFLPKNEIINSLVDDEISYLKNIKLKDNSSVKSMIFKDNKISALKILTQYKIENYQINILILSNEKHNDLNSLEEKIGPFLNSINLKQNSI